MLTAQHDVDMSREQEIFSTKNRLDAFHFRRTSGPVAPLPPLPASSVGRPHSRHGSVSLSGSLSTNAMEHTSSRPSSLVGRPRPVSHHRRRSSVSTRAESAEMMGISIPDLPPSSSDDNINFGDKDCVRRRALQALEGRKDLGLCGGTVEIPDISKGGIPQRSLDRDFKLPATVPSYGIPSLPGKRDSFGKFISCANSLKDQLHTLMEEEEEEEETNEEEAASKLLDTGLGSSSGPTNSETDCIPDGDFATSEASDVSHASSANRHRPANLNLRPLSLVSSANPLPASSYAQSSRSGLRPFSLGINANLSSNMVNNSDAKVTGQVLHQKTDRHSNSSSLSSSASFNSSSPSSQKRRSSISYIRSGGSQPHPTVYTFSSLPTPGATPTSERRQSDSSISSFGSISNQDSHNTSEDVFLSQSHASLLSRIAELENALQLRLQSERKLERSNEGAGVLEARADKMVQLVADLKAERDDLSRDIEDWRKRVKDLEHSKVILGHEKAVLERQLEAERREKWLKDERLGLLEMEKNALYRQLTIQAEEVSTVSRKLELTQAQLQQAHLECESLREVAEVAKRQLASARVLLEARREVEAELVRLRNALAAEQIYRGKLVSQLDAAGVLKTPTFTDNTTSDNTCNMENEQLQNNEYGFQSIDSACTTVDTDEESQQSLKAPFMLKAVEEELEIHPGSPNDDADHDELARYENEDDFGISIGSPTQSISSCDSDEFPRSLSHLRLAANGTPVPSDGTILLSSGSPSSTPSPTPSPCMTPIPLSPEACTSEHVRRASLSEAWTFPHGRQAHSPHSTRQEVDRFFGCLEDVESPPPVEEGRRLNDRSLFSQRLRFSNADDEELPPFVLPAQKSSGEPGGALLDVVLEEDEGDAHYDSPDVRSKSSFPISVRSESFRRMSSPFTEDNVRMSSVSFIFPQMKKSQGKDCKHEDEASFTDGQISQAGQSKSTSSTETSLRAISSGLTQETIVRSTPPSRIPPPSPPKFIQARSSSATPSPSSRRLGPPATVSPSLKPRLKKSETAGISSKSSKRGASHHGPSFIPQLRVSSSPESQDSPVSVTTISTATAVKHDEEGSQCQDSGVQSSSLPPLTSLIPLLSFPWTRIRSQVSVAAKRDPIYVPKGTQLAKLRANMTARQQCASRCDEITKCARCRSGLISL